MNADRRRFGIETLAALALNVIAAMAIALGMIAVPVAAAQAQEQDGPAPNAMPVVSLDAVDPAQWSVQSISVAAGQTIRVTNRGVLSHTFVVPQWGVKVELPTLEPVDIVVPDYVYPGETYGFLCDEAGHADQGMVGTITIVTAEEASGLGQPGAGGTPNPPATSLQANDNLTWSPNALELEPGQILEVHNPGVIEHHFVVDEWGINETISAGETVLVRVPANAQPGATFTFYCSVPGHRAAGMEGTITVTSSSSPLTSSGGPGSSAVVREVDVRQFVPDAEMFGEGWSEVRSGNVRSIVPEWSEINVSVFPGDGIGIVFVGPSGSRAAVAVLPLETTSLPTNQVRQAIDDVQFALMQNWNTNESSSVNLEGIPPPTGCSIAQRATGVTGLHTLPAGVTVCQVRNANVAIFVTIEGELRGLSGVEASDQIVVLLLDRFGADTGERVDAEATAVAPSPAGTGAGTGSDFEWLGTEYRD
jgi:plastocyanin